MIYKKLLGLDWWFTWTLMNSIKDFEVALVFAIEIFKFDVEEVTNLF